MSINSVVERLTMRSQYRVTKYDPSFRDANGAFLRDDWTSYSDIGRIYNGALLSESQYLTVENAYLLSIEEFLREARIETLQLRGLEHNARHTLPQFIQPQALLSASQCVEFARIALREIVWGMLVAPGQAYVHFGYDYYMYIRLPTKCPKAITAAHARGLFVERFRSPYLREHSNPAG
ncbi:hypothetical protein [Oryzomicrobium sp.]|uniref:hypothetical protein n=1 Tax=Oryzomicrobium sp. TaxID=1911578 RepID=UPI002FDF2B3A